MKIYDITPTISERLAVFPGDIPFSQKISMSTQRGDHLGLSSMTTTLHLGAHADAPMHYGRDAADIAQIHVGKYLGQAQVIRINKFQSDKVIREQDIANIKIQAPRVLFSTNTFSNPNVWCDSFASLSADLIASLAQKNCILLGIDTPSVDHSTSKDLPAHQALLKHHMSVLEGLVLDHVPDGVYTLVALPLAIANGDASPVRAILIDNKDIFTSDPSLATLVK